MAVRLSMATAERELMKIGISVASAYNVADVRQGARQMIDRTRAAARANLDSLFVGDHHVVPTPYYQNTPMLGRMLAEWHNRAGGRSAPAAAVESCLGGRASRDTGVHQSRSIHSAVRPRPR